MPLKARIQHRRDTASNWETNNPVLLDGELIIVVTNAGETRYKVGDGTKTYTQLPFADEIIRSLINERVLKVEGMGLSTNDFSDADKTKLDGIDEYVKNIEPTETGLRYTKGDGSYEDIVITGSGSVDSDAVVHMSCTDDGNGNVTMLVLNTLLPAEEASF